MNLSGIICGLGNPGTKYAGTRHNAGFMVIDEIISQALNFPGQSIIQAQKAGAYTSWEWTIADQTQHNWLLVKPQTFMNRSGLALVHLFRNPSLSLERLLVVHDEVDLPLGKIRIKHGGGLAGHNGLRSIAQELGSRDFYRLRFGVGRPEHGSDLAGYVLSRFMPHEESSLQDSIGLSAEIIKIFCQSGLQKAMDEIARSGTTQAAQD